MPVPRNLAATRAANHLASQKTRNAAVDAAQPNHAEDPAFQALMARRKALVEARTAAKAQGGTVAGSTTRRVQLPMRMASLKAAPVAPKRAAKDESEAEKATTSPKKRS